VLLIEDDEVVRKMVAGILTADGYRVAAASSFATAGRDVGAMRPVQLLIAPVAGEAEKFIRRLVEMHPGLRVLCTGQGEECKSALPWLPPERQAALMKPYALSELLRAARKLLDA
jgi:two-component system, cell cycle sensor histidine kinase and response regulator CckA